MINKQLARVIRREMSKEKWVGKKGNGHLPVEQRTRIARKQGPSACSTSSKEQRLEEDEPARTALC
jgi:hypothetical protein